MSLRAIRQGEELTVDYNYDETDETMHCRCEHEAAGHHQPYIGQSDSRLTHT